ncbi:hypothetical protein GCM10027421_23870 [Microbacterium shaanxiense]
MLRLERAPISWGLMIAATLLVGVTIALVWFVAAPWVLLAIAPVISYGSVAWIPGFPIW